MSQYEKPWQAVRERVERAARAAGRDPRGIALLAVSKTFPADAVRAVHALGQRAFGESYVQEAAAKMDATADLGGVEWHMIGPLQGNKARVAAQRFAWVQTIDRSAIAERLAAARPAHLPPLNVHLRQHQRRRSKSGVAATEVPRTARRGVPRPRCAD
jgi:pyridoxal phosphate enzyme (YggS family)